MVAVGPSVGRISVTVVADTGKLKAEMIREGKKAGEATAAQIEKALSNLNASLAEIDGKREAKVLRKELELALRGIEVDIDLTESRAKLKKFEEETEATELALDLALSRTSVEKVGAQLDKMSEEQRQVFFDLGVDTAEVEAELERIEAERRETKVRLVIDSIHADARLKQIEEQRREARIRLEIDAARADAALARYEHLQRIDVPFGGDFTRLNTDLRAMSKAAEAQRLDVSVGADIQRAITSMAELEAFVSTLDADIPVAADLARARIALAEFRALQENNDLEIPVNFDVDAIDAALARAEARVAAGGGFDIPVNFDGGGGGGFGGLSGRMQAIIGAVTLLLEPAIVGLQGAFAALTSVASSAFSAIAGGAGAAAPLIAALGASVGTLIVGFEGMGDAISAVNAEFAAAVAEGRDFNINAEDIAAAMSNLAPAAQEVVRAFSELKPQFDEIRSVVQERLFAGVGDQLRALGDTAIPAIGRGLAGLAGEFNQFFGELGRQIEGMDIAAIFRGLQPVVDNMLRVVSNLFGAIEPFLLAAAPAAEALSAALAASANSLSSLIQAGAASGELQRFLLAGVESLKEWGRLLSEVAKVLFTVFEAGKASGDAFVRSLTAIVAEFNDFLKSAQGQEALFDFFESGKSIMKALVPVLTGLAEAIRNVVTPGAIDRFTELGEAVGRILPVMGNLINVIGEGRVLNTIIDIIDGIGQAIAPVLPQVSALAAALGEGLSKVVETMTPFWDDLFAALGRVAVAITPLIPDLTALAVAILDAFTPILIGQIEWFASVIEDFAPLIGLVIDAFTIWMRLIGPLGRVMGKLGTLLGTVFDPLNVALDFIIGKIETFLDLIGRIPFLKDFLDWLGVTTDESEDAGEAVQMVSDAADHLRESVVDLNPQIEEAADVIEGYTEAELAAWQATTRWDRATEDFKWVNYITQIGEAAAMVEGYTDDQLAAAAATALSTQSMQRNSQAAQDLEVDVLDARGALIELNDAFGVMGRREDALSRVFALGNAPKKAAAATRDIEESLVDLKEELKTVKVGDVIAGNFKADAVLDVFDDLRPQIQDKVNETFMTKGEGPAREAALGYIAQVTKSLGGAFKPAQIAKMLGLADFEETIKLAVKLEGIEQAQQQLEILTGLGGDTPLTATLALALNTDKLSSDAVTAITNTILAERWNIPANLLPTIPPEALTEAQKFIDENPGLFPVGFKLDPAAPPLEEPPLVDQPVQQVLDPNQPPLPAPEPITVPVTFDFGQVAPGQISDVGELGALVGTADFPTAATVLHIIADKSDFDAAVADVKNSVGVLDDLSPTPTINADTTVPVENVEGLVGQLTAMDELVIDPPVSLPGAETSKTLMEELLTKSTDLSNLKIDPNVSTPGGAAAISTLDTLTTKADKLDGKVIDIIIRQTGSLLPNLPPGGVEPPGGMAGELITHPTIRRVGERGLREAIIPLQLPLSRVDPSVRHLAELLRGGGATSGGINRQVNNYMTITPASADPAAVATQLINRAAALAAR